MRNKVIAAIVVIALLVGGGWYYKTKKASSASAQGDRIIEAPVRRGDINVTISGTGPVASVNGVTVKSNQTGTVTQVLAKNGDKVKAGQVIMVLDNKSLQSALTQAKLDLQTNSDTLNNLLHPLDTSVQAQQLKVQGAQLTLQQRQTDVGNLTVEAPVSGMIVSVNTTVGSNVNSGAQLYTIYDDSHPTFVVNLSQEAAAAIKLDSKVTVSITGYGDAVGFVQASGASATPAGGNRDALVPVSIALNPARGVRPGMVGTVSFNNTGLPYLVQASGAIKNEVTQVQAQVAGTVNQLAFKEGWRVSAGDLMATLQNDTLTNQLAQARNDLAVQQQGLANLLDPAKDPTDTLRTTQTKIATGQINLAQAQSNVDDLTIKAPVDGVVSALTAQVGDRITTGTSVYRVANYSAMQVDITVDELDIAKVQVGQKASITLDALPNKTYSGKVIQINPEGVYKNDIANFTVTVQFDESTGLMAGMNSTVNVVVTNRPQVLFIPAQALHVRQGKAFVQVKDANGQPADKEIQIGVRTDSQVEVTGGLNEGDRIIVTIIKASQSSGFRLGGGMFGGGDRGGQQPGGQQQGGQQQGGQRAPQGGPSGGGNFGGGGNSGGGSNRGGNTGGGAPRG